MKTIYKENKPRKKPNGRPVIHLVEYFSTILISDRWLLYGKSFSQERVAFPTVEKKSQFVGKRTILLAYLCREKTWKFKTNLVLSDTLIDIVL